MWTLKYKVRISGKELGSTGEIRGQWLSYAVAHGAKLPSYKNGESDRRWETLQQKKDIPHPDDIETLASYVVNEIKKLELSVSKSNDMVFREAVILTEARLLYNRRPGKLESP